MIVDSHAYYNNNAYRKSAMISCKDGFLPVIFYIEALDEDAE